MRSTREVCGRGSVKIHPTAIIHPDAQLGDDVEVGPYSIIAGTVKVGSKTVIHAHAVIEGHTTLGAENEIFTGAVVGSPTQDRKYEGGISYLKIGDRNKIREYVTINPGTKPGTETVIGNDNLLMAYAHVAHDCVIKNNVTLANVGTLAGHVIMEDRAIVGGLSAAHQFVRIGKLALIGGCSKVGQDVPSFMIADGHPAKAYGINSIGLDRAGYKPEDKSALKKSFRIIFKSGLSLKKAIEALENEFPTSVVVRELIDFLKASERGICR